MNKPIPSATFYGLGIAPALLSAIERIGFATPTPIQAQAIPIAVQGKDVVGIAQTGTGKTLAFGIPMIQRLQEVHGLGLILAPTRELAIQIDEALRKIGQGLGLRTAVLIGGASMGLQMQALRRSPQIIVATPGRLLDHMNQRTVRLHETRIAVFDEADRMLDMGFLPQIEKIIAALPRERQTMLFSATMPPQILKLATGHMKLPIRVEVAPSGTTSERVTHELFIVHKEQKLPLLEKILYANQGSTLIFTRTKYGAKRITHEIRELGITTAELHSNRSLGQRREALEGFKTGRYRVLVATDIASRGIDVVGIELVLNFDLPSTSDDYVHRIGRTARAGAGGHAITFAMPNEQHAVRGIERFIKKSLPVSKLPELPPIRHSPAMRGGGGPAHPYPPTGGRSGSARSPHFAPRPHHPGNRPSYPSHGRSGNPTHHNRQNFGRPEQGFGDRGRRFNRENRGPHAPRR